MGAKLRDALVQAAHSIADAIDVAQGVSAAATPKMFPRIQNANPLHHFGQGARQELREYVCNQLAVPPGAAAELFGDPSRGHSYVYFLRGPKGRIKIGTTTDVASRIAALQSACPEPLELVAAIPGGHRLERALHRAFAHSRITGEWFARSAPLAELITIIGAKRRAP